MGIDTFRRHTRACVDAALHRVFASRPSALFERLLGVARARSDLLAVSPNQAGEVVQVRALANLSAFERELVRPPEDWPGATGHPLRVVDSLASHLFAHYPTPRFLASAWLGGGDDPRRWFIAHGRGQRFRSLALPIAMTRQMEHVFLRTPDHYSIDHALRRAEVLGLGGTPLLAEIIIRTRLGEQFTEPDRWRLALAWLARCGDTVNILYVGPIIDFLHANPIDLRGRTFASVMRLVTEWHGLLALQRGKVSSWPRSRWNGMMLSVTEPRPAEWAIVELLDSHELVTEGRRMRHCVATYASACAARHVGIWSLRYRGGDDEEARSVLTIEVRSSTREIVQLRGKSNSWPTGLPLQLVRSWASREGLRFGRYAF